MRMGSSAIEIPRIPATSGLLLPFSRIAISTESRGEMGLAVL